MNQRNVDALCRIYADAFLTLSWQEINDDLQAHMPIRDAVVRGIEKMVSAGGVLVPSALTDDDLHLVYDYLEGIKRMPDEGDDERELLSSSRGAVRALERIAKGEA